MKHKYTKEQIIKYFEEELELFNNCMDSDFSMTEIKLDFYTPENALMVYKRFCSKYFPDRYEKKYETQGSFDYIVGMAFVNDNCYGMLLDESTELNLFDLKFTILHELSHIFCTMNEIDGGHFFDKYCAGEDEKASLGYAGYAIWREIVADIMAEDVADVPLETLYAYKDSIEKAYQLISGDNTISRDCIYQIIMRVMLCREVACTSDWESAENAIRNILDINNEFLITALREVFENIHEDYYWTITPEFMEELGSTYYGIIEIKEFQSDFATKIFEDI